MWHLALELEIWGHQVVLQYACEAGADDGTTDVQFWRATYLKYPPACCVPDQTDRLYGKSGGTRWWAHIATRMGSIGHQLMAEIGW